MYALFSPSMLLTQILSYWNWSSHDIYSQTETSTFLSTTVYIQFKPFCYGLREPDNAETVYKPLSHRFSFL